MSKERSEMTNGLTNGVHCINSIIYLLSRVVVSEMRLAGFLRELPEYLYRQRLQDQARDPDTSLLQVEKGGLFPPKGMGGNRVWAGKANQQTYTKGKLLVLVSSLSIR